MESQRDMIMKSIYDYCNKNNLTLIDFGISHTVNNDKVLIVNEVYYKDKLIWSKDSNISIEKSLNKIQPLE